MRRTRVLIALAAVLTACTEPPTNPVDAGPQDHGYTIEPSWRAFGIVGSALGFGTLDVTSPPLAIGEAEFQFVAVQTRRGAFGRFHMVRQRAGFIVDFSGDVTCMSFDAVNNRAWIGGVVRENRSTDPNHLLTIHQPGKDVWFRVVDNGIPGSATPDRSSVYGFEGAAGVITSAEYCQRQLWTAGDVNAFVATKGFIDVQTP